VALTARLEQMDEMTRAGRYPGEGVVQQVSRGLAAFAREDYPAAITILSLLLLHTERLGGGSRAQNDLVEFTVLRACYRDERYTSVPARELVILGSHRSATLTRVLRSLREPSE
jgi:hypothetical protein